MIEVLKAVAVAYIYVINLGANEDCNCELKAMLFCDRLKRSDCSSL